MSVLSLSVASPLGSRWRFVTESDDLADTGHSGQECDVVANADARYVTIEFDDHTRTWAVARELPPLADVPRGAGEEYGL
jgi:hypothetical protein